MINNNEYSESATVAEGLLTYNETMPLRFLMQRYVENDEVSFRIFYALRDVMDILEMSDSSQFSKYKLGITIFHNNHEMTTTTINSEDVMDYMTHQLCWNSKHEIVEFFVGAKKFIETKYLNTVQIDTNFKFRAYVFTEIISAINSIPLDEFCQKFFNDFDSIPNSNEEDRAIFEEIRKIAKDEVIGLLEYARDNPKYYFTADPKRVDMLREMDEKEEAEAKEKNGDLDEH